MSKFVMQVNALRGCPQGTWGFSLVIRLDASPCSRAGVIKAPILTIRSYTRQYADIHHPYAAMQCNTLRRKRDMALIIYPTRWARTTEMMTRLSLESSSRVDRPFRLSLSLLVFS